MTRETVVFIIRGRARNRSIARPGWFCWTCKSSRRAEPEAAAETRSPWRRAKPGFWRESRA